MASAADVAEMNHLTAAVPTGYDHVWIGLQRSGSLTWRWSDPARETGYRKWHDGHPSTQPGICAAVFGFDILMLGIMNAWISNSCSDSKPFVCFDEHRGFVAVSQHMDWTSAQAYCRTHHTDLPSVQSDAQSKEVWDRRPSGAGQVWIGLFTDAWRWADGTGSSFRNWRSGKPDHSSGKGCAALVRGAGGRWEDLHCANQCSFICAGAPRAKRIIVRVKMCIAYDNITSEITDQLLHQLVAPWAQVPDMKVSWRRHTNGEILIKEENNNILEE